MKKTILLLVAIALTSAKMMAEGLTATLQQGETMTAFYGVNAFVDAYNAAEDGAVITLSEGKFNDVSSIEKSITVIGNMAFDVEGYEKTYLANDRDVTINADKKPRVNSWSYLVNSQLKFNYQKDMINWLKQYNEQQLISG